MTALAENPAYIEMLEARVGFNTGEKPASFYALKWSKDREFECSRVESVTDLPPLASHDLKVIIAPYDSPATIPGYRGLVEQYEIPSGFVLERAREVTHSFGASLDKKGMQTVWAHFLCSASSPDVGRSEWHQAGVVLKWSAGDGRVSGDGYNHIVTVTLICFCPMQGFTRRLGELSEGDSWEAVLRDPYLLLDMVYECWYLDLDDSVWRTNGFCREIEKVAFQGTRGLDASAPGPPVVDLHHVHTVAKNSIFMLEGVDGTLRSLEAAIAHHQELHDKHTCPTVWRTARSSLLHRKELFHATRLRVISVEKRLTNVINLAFNVDTMRNSRIAQRDSDSLKVLSLAATFFLPLSTVASVFSTPFFQSSKTGSGMEQGDTLLVNSMFWLLWVISMPITIILVVGWWMWERRTQRRPSRPDPLVASSSPKGIGGNHT